MKTASLALWWIALGLVQLDAARAQGLDSFRAPPGVRVEQAAADPLVKYPLFACFDDRGRLFVAEGTGKNLPGPEIVPLKLGRIAMLEDTDGDGKFDKRTVFADQLISPQGVQWHNGSVYVASHPAIWKLTDADGDGVAEQRVELVSKFGFTGNGCDIHGPFAGPDGWLYWTQGRHGYRIDTADKQHLEGLAARVWRCRYDGTGLERVAGGGFDNAVELAFTESGELAGTMDQYPGDMLLQFVEGGVYPRGDEPTLAEFPRTGPLLGAIAEFSPAYPAALCGLVRLRTDHFGPTFRGALMTTQFNVRRIQSHALNYEGAGLRSENRDFIVSSDWDFHPTDVLEDADGSVLVVDMGSWFNYACPTQKIAKVEVTGSIIRVRRDAAPRFDDPWGNKLAWPTLSPAQLVELLSDHRAKVSARAVEELVRRGDGATAALTSLVEAKATASLTRREAIYALSRIGSASARRAVRGALKHADADTRQVAAHCVSVERDAAALADLALMVVADDAPRRRIAAEALGRLGRAEAVQPLLQSLGHGPADAFLEHSLIFALIRIGSFESTLAALQDVSPRVQRAALIALDQMSGTERRRTEIVRGGGLNPYHGIKSANPHRGDTFVYVANARLTREQVEPLGKTDDFALQLAFMETGAHRPEWSEGIVAIAAKWVRQPRLEVAQRAALVGALLGAATKPEVQQFVAAVMTDAAIAMDARRALLSVLARNELERQPTLWLEALTAILRESNGDLLREALTVARVRKIPNLDQALLALGNRRDLPEDLRLTATGMRGPRGPLDAATFERLTAQLNATGDPLLPVSAANALGAARLEPAQKLALTKFVAQAGPLTAPLLARAFLNTRDATIAVPLARALTVSPGSGALVVDTLEDIFGPMPSPEIRAAAQPLYVRHERTLAQQADYLGKLGMQMSAEVADAKRGEQVFFSPQAMCSVCHEVNGRGGKLGPDLSRIGSIRRTIALLESIVFPSSGIVPEFRAYSLKKKDGSVARGLIARETAEAVFLRSAALEEIRVPRSEIESVTPSDVSFMPEGLEKTMTPQQLNDLLEYLFHLK